MHQAVVPATGLPSASVQSKAAPPQTWTSIPKCRLYQACSDGASLALKKMPPMPVTRFMGPPMDGGGDRKVTSASGVADTSGQAQNLVRPLGNTSIDALAIEFRPGYAG